MPSRFLAILILLSFSAGCGSQTQNKPAAPGQNDPAPVQNVMVPVNVDAVNADGVAIDPQPRIAFNVSGDMCFGLTVLKDAQGLPLNKLLTFDHEGVTNSTLVKVDNRVLKVDDGGNKGGGRWTERDGPFGKGGSKSVWQGGSIKVTQLLEIVPSQQPVDVGGAPRRLLDTLQVRFLLENTDMKNHEVGFRIMLDTLIGSNDGVPFTVPGLPLVTTFKDFPNAADVPDFIQALEIADLQNPGTVANLSLKLGGKVEPPSRVSLTLWPGDKALDVWNVPMADFSRVHDSCVVLYWKDQTLKPKETRELGFTYGMGRVSSAKETGGKLGLTVNGPFVAGESFSLTAYVKNPVKGQTVTLELPPGLERTQGDATQQAELMQFAEATDTAIVTWKIKAQRPGGYTINVRSSAGIVQAQPVSIGAKK